MQLSESLSNYFAHVNCDSIIFKLRLYQHFFVNYRLSFIQTGDAMPLNANTNVLSEIKTRDISIFNLTRY